MESHSFVKYIQYTIKIVTNVLQKNTRWCKREKAPQQVGLC